MTNSNSFNNFNEFWVAYLQGHASAASRGCHYAGTALGLATAAWLLSCGMIFFLPLAVVPAHVGAFLGHRLGLRGAEVSAEAPIWASLASLKMLGLFVTGRIDRELAVTHTAA